MLVFKRININSAVPTKNVIRFAVISDHQRYDFNDSISKALHSSIGSSTTYLKLNER